jgi:hypothetical protein
MQHGVRPEGLISCIADWICVTVGSVGLWDCVTVGSVGRGRWKVEGAAE